MDNRTKIKICGLKSREDILCVNELEVDYIGFVFAKKGHRTISDETARELRDLLKPSIPAVGVFIREPIDHVAALCRDGIIDLCQLHGGEDEAYIRALREQTNKPLIQAFRVESRDDVLRAQESSADYILLDNGGGGTGESFDWSCLQEMERPFFLAGGLSPENVEEALLRVSPWGVDVSSGVETEKKKDPDKMRSFVARVRAYQSKK